VKGNYQWPAPLKSVQEAAVKKAAAADKTRRGGAQDNEAPKGKKAREKSSDAGAAGKSSALSKSGPAGARGAGASAAGRMADTNLPEQEREEKNKLLSNQQIVEKILNLQKLALENAQYFAQITYCETSFCHRFVHFEVDSDYIEQFEPILNEYIESLKGQENDGILHYHLQEMPSKKQLANMDPSENFKLPGGKRQTKAKDKKPVIKDLDGNILGDDSQGEEDPFDALDQDDSFKMANGLAADYYDDALREKSYTLTMIADPDESGIEKTFVEYKKWMLDNNIPLKPKRMIINAGQNSKS